MEITIFIDESGDFETTKGKWVISGFVCFDNYQNAIKVLENHCKDLPVKHGLPSIKNFHLTEIRRNNYLLTHTIASDLFQNVLFLPEFKGSLISVINESKIRISEKERTYRLMLLDLIAYAEANIGNLEKIESLELVIATRTDANFKLMTTQSQIEQAKIDNIKLGLEEGLTSKGLIELDNSQCIRVTMDSAVKNWGLIVADFISNIIYNGNKEKDSDIINNLMKMNLLNVFESFGNFEERRAKIATRDKQYITALSRWAEIYSARKNAKIIEELKAIINELIRQPKIRLLEATIEAVIERVWRQYTEDKMYSKIYKILFPIREIICGLYTSNKYHGLESIVFRLNNILLQCCNHNGDNKKSEVLINEQKELISILYNDPKNISLIMDYYLFEIDYLFNDLQLICCLEKSHNYFEFVKNYYELWELLNGSSMNYVASREFLRAKMNLIKYQLYTCDPSEKDNIGEIICNISSIKSYIKNKKDYHRLLSLEILAHIKTQNPEMIIQLWDEYTVELLNEFDIYIVIRAVNDGILKEGPDKFAKYSEIMAVMESKKSFQRTGHPNELIMREFALYYLLNGQDIDAKYHITKSFEKLKDISGGSKVSEWLNLISKFHLDFIIGRKPDTDSLLSFNEKIGYLDNIKSISKPRDIIYLIRIISPY